MKFSKPDSEMPTAPEPVDESGPTPIADKRVAARRRFLKIGAGGSAAVVVTVTHRRAFAKKASGFSACASPLTPDLKKATAKKALEASTVSGGYKNLICRKPGSNNPPIGNCTQSETSKFWDANGLHVPVAKKDELEKGCGTLQQTVDASYNYRLYEKGYCPITLDPKTGQLGYDQSKVFYAYADDKGNPTDKKDGKNDVLQAFSCEMPPP